MSRFRILLAALAALALCWAPARSLAAVAYKGEAHSANAAPANNSTSFTVNSTNPAGSALSISAGDKLLVMVVVTLTSGDPGAISVTGFTEIGQAYDGTNSRAYFGWRDAQSGDTTFASSWTSAARGASWAIISFTGAATGAPPSASLAVDSGSNTSMVAPSVTASTASDMLFSGWTQFGVNGTYTVPGSMTSRFNLASTSSDRPEVLGATEQLSASGATGTRTATQGAADISIGMSAILTASGGGGATPHGRMMRGFGN